MDSLTGKHYGCVGIGVGPANLSLASLLRGHPGISNLFLDRKASFGWHDGQQIPGASLQVSPLKDLVSLSDPTNSYSFLSYLHSQGRIYHFINAQFDAVPRQEFRNYLEWASQTNENVVFGEDVVSVQFDDNAFVVQTSNQRITADNISIGIGTQPWVPAPAKGKLGATQLHCSEYLYKAADVADKRVCVVGGGQSGAEAFLDLISRPDNELPRQVSWISRRPNYFPIDDTPFTNEYYMPCHSDHFYNMERQDREAFNATHVLTSDGVSEVTLRAIYQRIYMLKFINGAKNLVGLHPNRDVVEVDGDETNGWRMTLVNNNVGSVENLDTDVIVWATGFRTANMDFLEPIAGRLTREGDEYRIDQDFAIQWDGPANRSLFLQNGARQQRGLADPNLSLVAWRSQRIIDRMRGVRTQNQLTSFIDWSSNSAGSLRRA